MNEVAPDEVNNHQLLQQRVRELCEALESVRLAQAGVDVATVTPILSELEALDATGNIDVKVLRFSRIGVELNKAWWRREAHGQIAQRAGCLVLRWMKRCSNLVGRNTQC
mmetsp:Transcript_27337/g.43367  ORF Transcript_27337/g.43367 Transcript_27337/m.43367 type:complete len:110 (+) Transcript_27337:2-331(+)